MPLVYRTGIPLKRSTFAIFLPSLAALLLIDAATDCVVSATPASRSHTYRSLGLIFIQRFAGSQSKCALSNCLITLIPLESKIIRVMTLVHSVGINPGPPWPATTD